MFRLPWDELALPANVGQGTSCARRRTRGIMSPMLPTALYVLFYLGLQKGSSPSVRFSGDLPFSQLNQHSVDDFGFPIHDSKGAGSSSRPRLGKEDLYSTDELQDLLNLHNQLQGITQANSKKGSSVEYPVPPSIHDAVLATLRDIDGLPDVQSNQATKSMDIFASPSYSYPITEKMRAILPKLRAIASDVDGTILTSQHTLHIRTERAIEAAVAATRNAHSPLQHFMLATGKSRAGALNSLGPKLSALLADSPGVFIQGLYCVDAAGRVVYEKRLEPNAVKAALELARQCQTSLFCYNGDCIQASSQSLPEHIREFHDRWGEPEPVRVVDDDSLIDFSQGYHKVLLMDSDVEKIRSIRPRMEELAAQYDCVVTQAVETMLELLPPNSSKAVGVANLCEALGIAKETELLAIGDGENDVGFLEQAAFGVAVGNAVPQAREAADMVLMESNNDGGAGVAIDLLGLQKIFEYE